MSKRLAGMAGRPRMPPLLQVIGDGRAGGGTTVVLQLSERMAARGADVTVASEAGSHLLEMAARSGLRTLPLDFGTRRRTPALAQALWHYLRAKPGTVVHAHGSRAGLPVALLPSGLAAARYYTVHGLHYVNKPAGIRHMAMAAERFCMARADATVFVAEHDRERALEARLLPRAAPAHVIANVADRVEPATEPPAFDIAFLGRLHPVKNPLILPQILVALRPLRPTLCVVGSGELEGALRRAVAAACVADQVTFTGALPHADALAVLDRARLMLLPSLREGLPVSVLEAMHRGIPVVASAVSGTAELVVDGETGFLVPPADFSAYAHRIGRLLTDDGLHARMGARALARARASFSAESHIAAHTALYCPAAAPTQGMVA